MSSLRVLYVLADPRSEVEAVRGALERAAPGEFQLTSVATPKEAVELLRASRYHAVLLEVPRCGGGIEEAVRALHDGGPLAPLVLLTSASHAAACSRLVGPLARECLVKESLKTQTLVEVLRGAATRFPFAAAEDARLRDALTGLPNRRGLLALAEGLGVAPGRGRKGLTVVSVDVAGLGAINETFGLPFGDDAVIECARLLRRSFRGTDLRARVGGDEFAVLAPGAPESAGPVLTARLAAAVRSHNEHAGRAFTLALHVGLASSDAPEPGTVEELLARAEEARRRRKKTSSAPGRVDRPLAMR